LLYKPKFLFLDELFGVLDFPNADDLTKVLMAYVANTDATCLMVTHDVDRAAQMASVVLYMNNSRTLTSIQGSPTLRTDLLHRLRLDLA
jgi:ABC-type nitrate/sulfonate/bicarbonate transport system ATPase subunit